MSNKLAFIDGTCSGIISLGIGSLYGLIPALSVATLLTGIWALIYTTSEKS